jgi:hypothetical protein
LNTALEDVIFQFICGRRELNWREFKEILRKTRESLLENIDPPMPSLLICAKSLNAYSKAENRRTKPAQYGRKLATAPKNLRPFHKTQPEEQTC